MRLSKLLLVASLCAGQAVAQNVTLPLETVAVQGSVIPTDVILDIAGVHKGAPIDKAGIEEACKKLDESGLFSSIDYHYAPGPKKGYALTLILTDQAPLSAATIDVPGLNEDETWRWLFAKFHRFDRQAPQGGAAQKYLAAEIERHLGDRLKGQHVTSRMETDLNKGTLIISFQPDVLPKIQSVAFTGNEAVASSFLLSALNRATALAEYTDRRFASAMELNLRPVYEERGYYRVLFTSADPQWIDGGVSLAVAVTEGATYRLGRVELVGEDLPVESMLSAAKLPNGKLANWKQIQDGIWEMEKVVKRTGFFTAHLSADRTLDDAAHVLDLRIRAAKGPLYHFGELHITGLSPDLEGQARRLWKAKAGDPFDYAYANDFFKAFAQTVDFRSFRKYQALPQKAAGDHVMDVQLVFDPR